MKRSSKKKITKKARVLRHIRVSAGISQREAGRKCSISEAAVGHYENGRMDVSEERLAQFLVAYKCSMNEFNALMADQQIPIFSVKEECIVLLRKLEESKLRTVHTVIVALANN